MLLTRPQPLAISTSTVPLTTENTGAPKKRKKKAGLEIEMGEVRCTVTFTEPKFELSELFSRIKRERPTSVHLRCDPVTPGEGWAKEVSGLRIGSP